MALLALAGLGQGIAGAMEGSANRKQHEEDREAAKDTANQRVAVEESMANPFRHQAAHGATVSALDRLERGSYTPVTLATPPSAGKYASYVPQMSGGFSYEKSPELRKTAGALKADVMSGRTAPTMTDPLNYGRTATLALDAEGNPAPGTRGGAASFRPSVDRFLSSSFTPTTTGSRDYTIADARSAIGKAFEVYQGRAATPEEIEQLLRNQGWEPGDRWVGQSGLASVISYIASAGA
jgi:hypothetical protein